MAKETMKKPSSRKTASGRGAAGRTDSGRTSVNRTASAKKGSSKKKKAAKKRKRMLIFAVEIVLLLVLIAGFYVVRHLDMLQKPENSDSDQVEKNENLSEETVESLSGYTNVALFGLDTRKAGQLGKGNRSDTMIIASINNDTKQVKLVSVYRDTYLDLTNGSYGKANAAFAGGGAERAISMLNKNLDLDITDFATVDFNGVIEAVDLLGGIEIEITEEERGWLNGYLVETSQVTGVSYEEIPYAGTWNLTGIQAMAYCRIRYTEGWDYKRTERQRIVLEKVFEKAKAQGVTGLASMVNVMMDYISTSLSNTELLSLAAGIAKYNIVSTEGFPFEKQAADISAGDVVVPVNLAANVTTLHSYLFGDENYTPSSSVQEISSQIIAATGIQ
jgi:LCP family protein required for cell wall assembly